MPSAITGDLELPLVAARSFREATFKAVQVIAKSLPAPFRQRCLASSRLSVFSPRYQFWAIREMQS